MDNIFTEVLEEFYQNGKNSWGDFPKGKLSEAVSLITNAGKVFVLGIGHSGFFGKILAMKLNHVGIKAYTVFDEINPPFEKGDLFVAISQSGGTATVISLASKAKNIGGNVLAVSAALHSPLAEIADSTMHIIARSDNVDFPVLSKIGEKKNQNLSGVLFGFNLYVLFYTIVITIGEKNRESADSIDNRHATLQ